MRALCSLHQVQVVCDVLQLTDDEAYPPYIDRVRHKLVPREKHNHQLVRPVMSILYWRGLKNSPFPNLPRRFGRITEETAFPGGLLLYGHISHETA